MADPFGPCSLRFKNILVLDDESDVCQALKDLLETSFDGVRVHVARSGMEALGTLRSEPIDLVVTDYRMPKMDGLQFLDAAKRMRPGIPHIMLTAYDTEVIQRRGASLRLLQKPLEPTAFLSEVQDVATSEDRAEPRPVRVLLVDDEPDIMHSFRPILSARLEADVDIADSASHALEALGQGHFDLLVTDERMPGFSGVDLIARAQAALPRLKCALFTAYGDDDLEARARQSGAVVLSKALHPFEAVARLRTLMASTA